MTPAGDVRRRPGAGADAWVAPRTCQDAHAPNDVDVEFPERQRVQ
jgi:hypothetical protein